MSGQRYGETVSSMSGAYALDALTPEEREIFERHLEADEALLAEVTEFKDTASILGLGVPSVTPPAALRERLLAQIARTKQEQVDHTPAPTVQPMQRETKPAKRHLPWWQRVALPAFGGLVAASLAVTFVAVGINSQQTQQQPKLTTIQALQADPNHETMHLNTARGAVTMLWSNRTQHAALQLGPNAFKLPNNSTYQLWATDSAGKIVSAGLVSGTSRTWHEFQPTIKKGSVLRMTVEPVGGSKQPTSDPLFTVTV